MTVPRLGVNLSNVAYAPWPGGYVDQIAALRPEAVVFYADSTFDPWAVARRDALHELVQRLPGLTVILRLSGDRTPREAPLLALEAFRRWEFVGLPTAQITPLNEWNLPSEAGNTDWPTWVRWWEAYLTWLRKLAPKAVRHLSALSPTGDYLDGYRALASSSVIRGLADKVDVHVYAEAHLAALPEIARLFPGQGISCTEFNGLTSSQVVQGAGLDDACYFIAGGTPDWAHLDLLRLPDALTDFIHTIDATRSMDVTAALSPNHDGRRATTLGVVLHATLGKTRSPDTEYDATLAWFANPASQVSAHAVVGPGGKVAYPVPADLIAWHCRASNPAWLGLEMCKAHVGDAIEPAILDAAARVVAGWCQQYAIPLVWSTERGLAEHRDMPTNSDGHQDVGGPFDRDAFLTLVRHYAGEDELTEEQKKAVLEHLGTIWGFSAANVIAQNPQQSQDAIRERVIAIKETLGLN